jgi:hypothetical protein
MALYTLNVWINSTGDTPNKNSTGNAGSDIATRVKKNIVNLCETMFTHHISHRRLALCPLAMCGLSGLRQKPDDCLVPIGNI